MMRYNEPIHVSSRAADAPSADQLRLAALAYWPGSRLLP